MPGKDRDSESGRYTTSYPEDDFIQAVRELGPAVGTQKVATKVGCSRDTAYRTLRDLEAKGEVASRKVGMVRLWSVTETD